MVPPVKILGKIGTKPITISMSKMSLIGLMYFTMAILPSWVTSKDVKRKFYAVKFRLNLIRFGRGRDFQSSKMIFHQLSSFEVFNLILIL